MHDNWFELNHPEKIDRPALLVYLDRARKNIDKVIRGSLPLKGPQ